MTGGVDHVLGNVIVLYIVGLACEHGAGWRILTGLASPFRDNFAHLGGFAGGALAALALRPRLLPAAPST